MPRAPQNRIGQIFGRWKIIKENQRGIAIDHGKLRSKIRNFSVECTNCGYIRENVSYKNIFYDKISHKECKTQHEKDHEALLNGKNGTKVVGQIIKNDNDQPYRVLNVKIPPKGKYTYKTLEYTIQCDDCGKKKMITYHSICHKKFTLCKCNKVVKEHKTREQIIEEIDKEFEWMMELNRMNELTNYMMNKFPDENWDKILEEDYG